MKVRHRNVKDSESTLEGILRIGSKVKEWKEVEGMVEGGYV